jgi:hypothetical protein
MQLQKIKIITADHPDILEDKINLWIETMESVNDSFFIIDANISTIILYSQQYISIALRYTIKTNGICG